MDAVALAAQRAIDQLSTSQVTTSSVMSLAEGGEYVMPPRTREELLATQHLVADSRDIPREAKKRDLADPVASSGVPPVRNNGVVSVPAKKRDPGSWLM